MDVTKNVITAYLIAMSLKLYCKTDVMTSQTYISMGFGHPNKEAITGSICSMIFYKMFANKLLLYLSIRLSTEMERYVRVKGHTQPGSSFMEYIVL